MKISVMNSANFHLWEGALIQKLTPLVESPNFMARARNYLLVVAVSSEMRNCEDMHRS